MLLSFEPQSPAKGLPKWILACCILVAAAKSVDEAEPKHAPAFRRISEACKARVPSLSQSGEQEKVMELFYPEAHPRGGFFLEAGGLDGLT